MRRNLRFLFLCQKYHNPREKKGGANKQIGVWKHAGCVRKFALLRQGVSRWRIPSPATKIKSGVGPIFQFRYGVRMYLKFVADAVVTLVYATNSGFVYAGRYVIVYKAAITTGFYKVIIQQLFQIL